MGLKRTDGQARLMDVLDRVIDKGIVIDAWMRLSVAGIDLITVETRIVAASIETYLQHAYAIGATTSATRPAFEMPQQVAPSVATLTAPRVSASPASLVAPRRRNLRPRVPVR